MELRRPHDHELAAASALCLRSKAVWGYDASFLRACEAELTLTARDLVEDEVVVAVDGDLVGVAHVSVDGPDAWLEKLFVDPAALRRGIGRALYAWALDVARTCAARTLVVEADPDAEAFYLAMGAIRDGDAPSGSLPGRRLPRLVHPL